MAHDITTASANIPIKRKTTLIERDESKVMCRIFMQGGDPARIKKTIRRINKLDEEQSETLLNGVLSDFSERHRNLEDIFLRHFQAINKHLGYTNYSFGKTRKMLIGAYFTMEYAVESAALFNPSIVPHPDQSDVSSDSIRVILSLRAVGEGHISSLVFRSGIINGEGEIELNSSSSYINQPKLENPVYDKGLFNTNRDLFDENDKVAKHILKHLPDQFTHDDLEEQITALSDKPQFPDDHQLRSFHKIHYLADSNYQLHFDPESDISERVIYPVSEEEKGGIEDARFIQFQKDDGDTVYIATYTAYDGSDILPQLIETEDFIHFKMRTLFGDATKDKDMALFPRKIDGRFAMLGRQDGVNIYLMFSDEIQRWDEADILIKPTEPWELIQMGTCASPIETRYGWLVLTHGVGPMRAYSVGAVLLDLEDPSRILKRLKNPLLKALEHQQIGYVPNVVYTCGALLHQGHLVIPYALSDIQPAVARIKLDDLIEAMEPV
jgi:predicted GH43/DUF377 family glycosyl hydrolase